MNFSVPPWSVVLLSSIAQRHRRTSAKDEVQTDTPLEAYRGSQHGRVQQRDKSCAECLHSVELSMKGPLSRLEHEHESPERPASGSLAFDICRALPDRRMLTAGDVD